MALFVLLTNISDRAKSFFFWVGVPGKPENKKAGPENVNVYEAETYKWYKNSPRLPSEIPHNKERGFPKLKKKGTNNRKTFLEQKFEKRIEINEKQKLKLKLLVIQTGSNIKNVIH